MTLYKFSSDSSVIGPMQLDSLIEQDETISSEISSLNVTGTKITKEMIMIPIDNTILYVIPIYQTSLNETNSVPVLKKVLVASGNKVAMGDTFSDAFENLLSSNYSVSIEVEDTETQEGLIQMIIKANNNLEESNGSNDWEQMGKDISELQALITELEEIITQEEEEAEKLEQEESTENVIEDTNINIEMNLVE